MNVVIRVHVKASILEYLGELKLSDDADRHKLERTISDLATQRAEGVLNILQRNNADSLGIGTHVRNSMTYSNWKQLDWHKKYPDIQIKCEVKIKIKDYGFRR